MLREYAGHTWERQVWETDAQYGAFLAYRDLGANRSIDAAYKAYALVKNSKKSPKKPEKARKSPKKTPKYAPSVSGTFKQWAKENEWSKRASDYDVFTQRALDEVVLESKKNAVREHIEELQTLALSAAKKMLEKPSLERIRKRYKVEKKEGEDVQQLVEVITEQQSVFASESVVRYVLDRTMSEHFRILDENIDVQLLADEELENIVDNKP